MHLRNVTLEISGKPFTDDSEQTMFEVGRRMFTQWKNLTDKADQISVMLWIADGSETDRVKNTVMEASGTLDLSDAGKIRYRKLPKNLGRAPVASRYAKIILHCDELAVFERLRAYPIKGRAGRFVGFGEPVVICVEPLEKAAVGVS